MRINLTFLINKRIFLILIILLAATLRFYHLDSVPPSLSWDEADVGYNAYTIANWGRDEWGKSFPAVFKSFGDDKHPVHVYFTALAVKLFGLSDFSVRLPAALVGVANVMVIYFLARLIFSSELAALAAAFSLAVSPYALQFSRFNHEANFALFFFMLGLLTFFLSVKLSPPLLLISALSFGVSLLSYHSSKIVIPPITALLLIFYWKELLKIKKYLLLSLVVPMALFILVFFNPGLLGTARIQQTAISQDRVLKTYLFQKTHSSLLGIGEISLFRYLSHFSWEYLAVSGDRNPRLSAQVIGEFYKPELAFIILGAILMLLKRSKVFLMVIVWALLAPLPASITGGESEAPHSARALFTMGSWHLIAAFGFYQVSAFLRKATIKPLFIIFLLVVYGWLLKSYLSGYYGTYARDYAIEWQYGMKQIVDYIKNYSGYFQVYTTEIRSQPYIFYLYYLRIPIDQYLSSVVYNSGPSKSYNLISQFDKYHFGDWNKVESRPLPGILYVLSPSEFDGLRYKNDFTVKEIIKYPNGTDAFFLISYP